MLLPRGWLARAFDALAVVVVLFAAFHYVLAPRLWPAAARPAPPLTLQTLGGARFSLAAHRGHVVFLDFWASWCEPCKASLPLVERYARAHPAVDVVPVDVGEDPAVAGAFARAQRLGGVVLDPDQIAAHAFGVGGFPTMVVIDAGGRVEAKWVGYNPEIEAAMAAAARRYAAPARVGRTAP